MNLTFFIFYCFVATITPGPNNILILSTVNNHGVKKALKFCYGAILTLGILLVLSVILNSYLNSVLPNILFVLQVVGSIYMLYLAYLIFNMNMDKFIQKEIYEKTRINWWNGSRVNCIIL